MLNNVQDQREEVKLGFSSSDYTRFLLRKGVSASSSHHVSLARSLHNLRNKLTFKRKSPIRHCYKTLLQILLESYLATDTNFTNIFSVQPN